MSTNPNVPTGGRGESGLSISQRVEARVKALDKANAQRDRAVRPGRKGRSTAGAAQASGDDARRRERRSLGRVFHELGDTHRAHRKESGEPVSVELREAANAFRATPNLTTLTAVAAFLDEEGLLAW